MNRRQVVAQGEGKSPDLTHMAAQRQVVSRYSVD
jgi:hypothetical protein